MSYSDDLDENLLSILSQTGIPDATLSSDKMELSTDAFMHEKIETCNSENELQSNCWLTMIFS
jgi:hypothetical protein